MADIIRPEFPQSPEDPAQLVRNINALSRKLEPVARSVVTWSPSEGEIGEPIAASSSEIMSALQVMIAWVEDFRTENPGKRFMRSDMSDHFWTTLFLARVAVERFERRRAEDGASKQIVLAGDSMFDNAAYVMGGPPVLEQMLQSLPPSWSAYKIAVDGALVRYVPSQLVMLPDQTTDLVLSIGTRDISEHFHGLEQDRHEDSLASLLAEPLADFRVAYSRLLDLLGDLPLQVSVCTICTAIPFEDPVFCSLASSAFSAFNEVIVEEAKRRRMPVIRLEDVCTDVGDFSFSSLVGPSEIGGQKIANSVLAAMLKPTR